MANPVVKYHLSAPSQAFQNIDKKTDGRVSSSRSIPSLDGLRALSVLAVMLGHTESTLLKRIPFNASFRNGGQGVAVFFVISGFLITHLLVKELRLSEQINLPRFYLRRTFRIFPPFYIFLLVVALLSVLKKLNPVSTTSMLAATTFTWNYVISAEGWTLGHCWSLALEEQFYLLWPACMAFFSRRTNLRIAAGVILLSPISRVLTYYAWPQMRNNINMMLHTRLDTIMMGCLLALIIDLDIWPSFRKFAVHPAGGIGAIVFLLGVHTAASAYWKAAYTLFFGFSLETLAIGVLLLYVVFCHKSPLGNLLNSKPLRHFGKISYSLYLWQELFTGGYTRLFPLNILGIVAVAEMSYLLVERPSFRIRDFVVRRLANSE